MSCKGFKILSLMQRWGSKREAMGDDPPYLAVGTEVSAKYKGAFCEAKVRKIVRSVKCKIAFKLGLGTATVTDDQIKGTLRAGSVVEVKHPDKKELVEATIIKIQDCSQYTVVFDDGDITTLRRTALCLKSGRHFAESETLDQLPLTHPEHFGNPVIGGRRGRRNRQDDSSDDDDSSKKGKQPKEEKEADIGKVVCVEISDKKKQKDNWFPGLVVAPTAQDTVKINVKEDYLVRSFKDGRYYTVPKKEATSFTREIGQKVDNNTLKIAVDKALLFLDRDELPPHWDRELLFGLNDGSDTDSDAAFDSDTSDDEPREEKDHFVAQLYKFMDDRGTPINKGPTINGRDVDLYKLFKVVHKLGGCNRVTNHNQWKTVSHKLGFGQNPTSVNLVRHAYKKFLHSFEDFYRKLGCTMVNHPRGQRSRHRGSNRSLIRDKDKALPTKDKIDKDGEDSRDELPVEPEKREKEVLIKEEPKPKELVPEPVLKTLRETRKDIQKPKSDKVEKKEDVKILPTISKIVDLPTKLINVRGDEKVRSDDREERIKLREMARADVVSKEDSKADKESAKNPKDPKAEESQRIGKATRREVKENKKEEKEEDKSKVAVEREGRVKKNLISTPAEPSTSSTDENKTKKPRSLFSKMTGTKRPKETSDKVPRANKTQIGVQSVRQKRTFSERMKAMVKKLKLKTGGGKHLRHKPPAAVDGKDGGDKKKAASEETPKQVVVPQLTRSKSKEEMITKTRKTELPVEKKASAPLAQPSNTEKKPSSTKKKKDDEKSSSEEILDLLPNYKSVAVGDKLKVYYGPTHESKVTYEAKVLSMKEEDGDTVYLVHYTGWNTRYDEWIRRNRIADNLSWSPGRAKRTRQPASSQGSAAQLQPRVGKRSKSRSGEVRSTTPSSVTSSSSRTKSPAVSGPGQRNVRSRQRTRRVSGHTHTDFSESEDEDNYESDEMENAQALMDQRLNKEMKEDKETKDGKELLMDRMRSRGSYRRRVESSCESEEPNSEQQENKNKKIKEENEEERTRSRSERKKTDEANKSSSSAVDDNKKEVGTEVIRSDRLRNKRKLAGEKTDSGDEKESKPEVKTEDAKSQKVIVEDKRKSDVKSIGETDKSTADVEGKRKLKRKSDEVTVEEDTKSNERRRSKRVTPRKEDLKCKEEEFKSEGQDVDQPKLDSKVVIKEELDSADIKELEIKEEDCENDDDDEEEKDLELESNSKFDTSLDDIYEFKEPEPFEFEVRSKCGEEKGGKNRRSFGRMSEEPTSPASVRKKLTRMKSESPTSFENKRNVKKSLTKLEEEDKEKSDLAADVTKEVVTSDVESKISPRPVSPKDKQKNPDTSSKVKGVPKDGEEMFQSLSLFSDLPGEGAGEEDSNDRLVISEPETEGESQEPLFSHQPRDHEDFFPTCITQSSPVDNSVSKSPFSGFAEKLKEEDKNEEENVQSKKRKVEEDEDDPIMSAIQRVFAQSSNEEEDSNDIDLLSELKDPVDKEQNVISMDKITDSNSESVKSIDSQIVENPDSQLSLSNESEENEVTITDPVEMNSEKIIEEINLASTDSETEEVPEIEESGNDEEESTTDVVEIADEPTKKDELQDDDDNQTEEESKVDLGENDKNNEEVKENVAQVNDDSVSSNSSVDGKVDRETASNSRSISEVDSEDNNEKQEEEVEEVEGEVELDEELIIETVEDKRDSVEENDDEEPTIVEEKAEEIVVEEPMEVDSKEEEVVKEEADKEEACEAEEGNLESLLCEETIPGSPAPSSSVAVENTLPSSPELPFASVPVTYKPPPPPQAKLPPPPPPPAPVPAPAPVPPSPANEAAPVMENTPPTTPESSLSPISNSPRGERSGSSPVPENESSKSNRDSSEADLERFPPTTKLSNYSEEDTNSGIANTNPDVKKSSTTEENVAQSIRKRRRSHKRSDDNGKRIKLSHRSPRHNTGSESDDDTSENSLDLMSLHSRSPRPSKYNFFVQLDPDLDVSQRIDVLQQKLTELRKTYMSVKAELAGIDRRRKKLRRRERDASVKGNVKAEVTCS